MTNLQDIVVKEMKVKKHIDSQQEIREIIQFIKNYVQSHTFIESLVPVSYTHLRAHET